MKKLKSFILILGIALGLGLMMPAGANAASVISAQCADNPDSAVCKDQNANPTDLTKNIVNILLFIVGAISVVMIIVGGMMYATSAGDSAQVTKAKNILMYAIVGLVVSFVAFAVVQFVVTKFTT
jgi:predicted small integral membrane protein